MDIKRQACPVSMHSRAAISSDRATIASAIGANHRVIEDGISGTLVNTDADWKKALENYILKPDLRKAHGIKARERVEALYSIKANEPVYLEVINKVIDSK